jgi:hypothetical protein
MADACTSISELRPTTKGHDLTVKVRTLCGSQPCSLGLQQLCAWAPMHVPGVVSMADSCCMLTAGMRCPRPLPGWLLR